MTDHIYSYTPVKSAGKKSFPQISKTTFIAPTAAIIGDVVIGQESSVWYQCTVRGDVNNIVIGNRTSIQDGTVIHVASLGQGTYIGDNVTVGHQALLHACTIGNNVLIGMQACIMDDARVEENAMVAAGSLVTPRTVVPSGELWAGRPARKMRDLTAEEIEYIAFSAQRYVDLTHDYLLQRQAQE